ncbi:putative phospholipase A2-like protein [Leptomonas seymouri]|uniref:1-alkyl-2-acetylglycerophosphocholine esterase n=1 Tax=Leptomonas seymouri TaxID=5684 RepID=A0A0N1I4R1_LEPSE|nr:putative phospholipase A2-like protein [Leptomonas seymouri]|eukprot:KPI85458.1 putative phospholipase A2-like protein [Leptomonas seymouri]
MGGRYNVGIRELGGDLGAMKPPISVFYPTLAAAAKKGVGYLPFDDTQYLRGMARYVGLPYFILMDLFFTRSRMRSAAQPVALYQEDATPRPIVIFSHGLAGFPRLYSTLLMDIAARGAIVFAVTHMDTSAAYCRDASGSIHIPLNTHLKGVTEDREPQLDIRVREIRNTLARLRSGELLELLGYEKDIVQTYLVMDQPVHLVGHSFGGSTVLAVSLEEEKIAKDTNVSSSVSSVTAYDPWDVPLRERMFYQKITDKENPYHFSTPTLQLFSDTWIHDTKQYSFFVDVEKVVMSQSRTVAEAAVIDAANRKLKRRNATWYTRKDVHGVGHLNFTDVVLFSPVVYRKKYMTVPPRAAIVDLAHETVQFINALSGSIPFEKDITSDAVLSSLLRS